MTFLLAIITIFFLGLSAFELSISPPVSYFDVQRERKTFDLKYNESLIIVNHTIPNVKRISIELISGNSFSVNYSLPSDTPIQNIITFSTTSHMFDVDGLRYFILESSNGPIKGHYEIDYSPQISYP